MKALTILFAVLAGLGAWGAANLAGKLPARLAQSENAAGGCQCPMHPWVKAAKPEACTICGMELVPIAASSAGRESHSAEEVSVPQGLGKGFNPQTAEVRRLPLVRTLRVAGTIGEDESRHGVITAPVDGRIDGLAMNCEGDQIHQRQPIANLFSRTLLEAAETYKRALPVGGPALEAARQNLERYGLVAEQIASIPARQPDDTHFGLIATLSGTVVKSYVSEGQYVKAGDKLFETADLSRLWFVFKVPEQDLPFVHKDQMVSVRTPSLPGQTLRAKIAFINSTVDETTHAVSVRVVLENPEGRLRNNVYAEGEVEMDAGEVLAVPRRAVLWPGNQPRVYVQTAPGTYTARTVRLGRAGDADWEVLSGLQAGERVVVAGNLLLDSQVRLVMEQTAPEVSR